jgi:cytochrome c oxidase subunit III
MSAAAPAVRYDASALPTLHSGRRSPLWWGMVGLLTIETVVFSTLITAYLYLRFHNPNWPPAGVTPPDLLLPTLNTGILIASSFAMYWADQGIEKRGDVGQLKTGLGIAMALAVVFLVLKVVEYGDVEYRWDTSAYGSVIWTIIVFHSAHVASVLLKGVVVEILAFRGHFTRERHLGVQINGLYWHFVVIIWIPLYVTIYLVPRIPW